MRILHWTDNFLPNIGGVETFVRDLTLVQRESGHEPVIVTRLHARRPTEDEWSGVPVYRRPFADNLHVTNPRELRGAVNWCAELRKRLRPDVVHLHLSGASCFYEVLSRSAWPCPVVVTPHGPLGGFAQPQAMTLRVLTSAAAIVGISAHLARVVEGELPGRTVDIVLNGVRVPQEEPSPLPDGPLRLIALGRLAPEKGFDTALRAMVRLPAARLVLAGDGPERANLERLSAELGVSDRVEFTGWTAPDRVPALIATGHLVLMPSRWEEPFGLVAVQAALMGRALIASRVGALPEIVNDGETGRLVPPDDPETLAATVSEIWAGPQEMARMGAAARRRAVDLFGMERCAAGYERVYQDVLAATAQKTRG